MDFHDPFVSKLVNQIENVQGQNQQDPNQSDPLGSLGQLLIHGAGLALTHVSIGATGNGTGQTGLLAGLEQNHQDQRDG